MARRHVGEHGARVAEVAPDPVGVVRGGGRSGDDEEGIGGESGHREVRLDSPAGVEHLGVDEAAGRHVDVVGAETLEDGEGLGPLQTKLAERGLVEEPHGLPHRLVLGRSARKPVLAPVAVAVDRFHARRRVPVRALPAHHHAEAGAAVGEPVVEHALAHAAGCDRLKIRPVDGVERADHLHRAVAQVARVRLEGRHAADVDIPEIHRRLAAHDPLRHCAAGACPRRDADGVEAGRDVEVATLRRFAQEEPTVGREAFGAVDVAAHRRALERGDPEHRLLHENPKVLPVLGQEREGEVGGDALHAPRLRHRLEAAHEQTADFLAHVDVAVGVAEHRQVRRHSGHGLGDDVEVLRGVKRHRDARHSPDLARPHPGAVHHDLARYVATGRPHARDAAVLHADRGHAGVLEDGRPALPRAASQRERRVDGIGAPVAWQPQGAHEVVDANERPAAARLRGRDDLHVDVEAARHGGEALELVHALPRPREAHAAGTPEARGLARLRLEPLVEIGAVLREPREVLRRAKLADEPGRVPGRATGDVAPLQQEHVAPAQLREVVGDAAAGDAAANHHDPRVRRERARHRAIRLRPLVARRRHGARGELSVGVPGQHILAELDAEPRRRGHRQVAALDPEGIHGDFRGARLEVHEVLGDQEVRDDRRHV